MPIAYNLKITITSDVHYEGVKLIIISKSSCKNDVIKRKQKQQLNARIADRILIKMRGTRAPFHLSRDRLRVRRSRTEETCLTGRVGLPTKHGKSGTRIATQN